MAAESAARDSTERQRYILHLVCKRDTFGKYNGSTTTTKKESPLHSPPPVPTIAAGSRTYNQQQQQTATDEGRQQLEAYRSYFGLTEDRMQEYAVAMQYYQWYQFWYQQVAAANASQAGVSSADMLRQRTLSAAANAGLIPETQRVNNGETN